MLLETLDPGSSEVRLGSSPLSQSHPESSVTQVISKPKGEEERARALRGLETELLEECISVSRDTLRFREIDPGAAEPPPQWIEDYGLERASEMLRCAKAGWDTKKNAPIAVQLAVTLGVGIMKSRSTEKAGARTLNAVIVQFPQNATPEKPFPVIDLPPDQR